ncbi:DUF1203 domain-containing protein [Massilia timonae]|uniref:DUF1203 domain-containing protein n=1 Tax=Massilia timonae TaxID=47229 RepID=UPI002896A6FB|nr:DUF1203 domain-containing protein [Massilia timonae]
MTTPSSSLFPIRIVPLADAFLARVRAGADDQGQPVERHVARGGEPLRDCLRRALPGKAILLASYCPFTVAGPYREYGPVFVSASSQPAARLDTLPLDGKQPYLGAGFVLRAYSVDERIVDAKLSSPKAAETDLQAFLARDQVAFVLVRFAAYGCFALRVARRWK